MNFPSTKISTVWHVGTLDSADRTDRTSLEGSLISVSEHPEEWSLIARCQGSTWEMERDGAIWLDALALTDDQSAEIAAWCVENGYVESGTIWRAWRYDDEADSWAFMSFFDYESAFFEVDNDDIHQLDGVPSENGAMVDSINGFILTPAGMDAVGRWHDATDAADAMIIIWADQVLKDKNPDLMGVWWYEVDDPRSLSCPRGGVFPDRLCEFRIENELGDTLDNDRAAFPEF